MVSTSTRKALNSPPGGSTGNSGAPRPANMADGTSRAGTQDKESAGMKLSMVAIEKGGLILVAAEGNITGNDVDPTQKNPLETLLGATWSSNRVLLNMEKTNYIDSSAIGWLMSTHRAYRDAGGAFICYNVQPSVRQLLDLLKLGKVLPLVENEMDARQIAGGAR